jgi:hypothetical protein
MTSPRILRRGFWYGAVLDITGHATVRAVEDAYGPMSEAERHQLVSRTRGLAVAHLLLAFAVALSLGAFGHVVVGVVLGVGYTMAHVIGYVVGRRT